MEPRNLAIDMGVNRVLNENCNMLQRIGKYVVLWMLCVLAGEALAQGNITKEDIKAAAKVFNLEFTNQEVDSMYFGVVNNRNTVRRMHGKQLDNSVHLSMWQLPVQPWVLSAQNMPRGRLSSGRLILPKKVELPANRDELAYYSLPQLSSLIKRKRISSVELTTFFIERIKKYADTLECLITLTEDLALQEARAADSLLRRGIYLGMLHGIPYGLKDLFAVKGTRTTWGAAPYKDQLLDEDAYVYTRLRQSGAVLVGKFTLGALAMGDYWFGGRTRSPWNLERGSSGSSAGSAAATAAGLVPFAIGTETWGSIISPSTACGATGLRPTFGRISRSGAMALSWSLDKIGPICRSAEDAAIVFTYINGFDKNDGVPSPVPFRYDASMDIRKMKIGYAKNYFDKLDSTKNEWSVLEAFRKMGVNPEPVVFPDDSTVWPFDIMGITLGAECAAAFDAFTRTELDDMMTRQNRGDWPNFFRTARLISAVDYINASRHRFLMMEAVDKVLSEYDVIICPSFAGNQLAITNLTGHPALSVPNGFDSRTGLPTSITFVGRLWGEGGILRAGHAYQQATDWDDKRPPLFQ